MSLAAIRAGRAEVELGIRDRLKAGLERGIKRLRTFAATANRIGAGFIGSGTSIVAPLLAATKVFTTQGDQLDKISRRSGIAVERLSELGFAAEQSGGDLQKFDKGVKGMQTSIRNLERGLSTSEAAFKSIGVTMADLEGKTPDEQFKTIATGIDQIQDPSRKAAIALEIFGRAGRELLPMLEGGGDGINALQKQARQLGLTISGQSATSAANLTDGLNELWRVIKNGVFQIGASLAPTLIDAAKRLTKFTIGVVEFIKNNRALIVSILGVGVGLVTVGGIIGGAGLAAAALAGTISAAITVFGALGSALSLVVSPIGLVVAGIGGATFAFLRFTDTGRQVVDWFKNRFASLKSIFTNTVAGMRDALQSGRLGLAAKIAFTALKLSIVTIMDSVLTLFGSSIDEIMTVLAKLYKRIGQVIARINKLRVRATNAVADGIGVVFLNEQERQTLAEDNVIRLEVADAFQESFDKIDTSQLGDSLRDALSIDAISDELKGLVEEAKAAKEMVDAAKALDPTPALINATRALDHASERFEAQGTFSAAAASRFGGTNVTQKAIVDSAKYLRLLWEKSRKGQGPVFS